MVNQSFVADPTVEQPGFDLPRHMWCALNHFPYWPYSLYSKSTQVGPGVFWQVQMWDGPDNVTYGKQVSCSVPVP